MDSGEMLGVEGISFDRLSIGWDDCSKGDQETSKYDEDYLRKWGFRLKELYVMALNFYKEKEGKALSLSYQDKLKLVALTKQVSIGRCNFENAPPLGVLDVIGRDRRLAWQSLGDMVPEIAMIEFIELLDNRCPMFRPYAQAHKADKESRRLAREKEDAENGLNLERIKKISEVNSYLSTKDDEKSVTNLEAHKRTIMEALNRQTYAQFKSYVEQHFPGDEKKQDVLMKELQEQHYDRYMEELMSRVKTKLVPDMAGQNGHIEETESEDEAMPSMAVTAASIWTRKDIKEFKESIRKEGGDAVIKVGHGETVTVRVPTNEEGSCLFWEFATDFYDIGFGVYFEWTKSPTSEVSVHVSESEDDEDYVNDDDDDDDDEDDEELGGVRLADIERGRTNNRIDCRTPITEILPVRRRDCMDSVYAGSHSYPGTGVYLLKFDNSYSLWRSKTLYYRVFYTR